MKTTLELPDDLYRKAKATAALRGETLTALLGKALEVIVAGSSQSAAEHRTTAKKRITKPANDGRMQKWREEEAAFLQLMSGPELDKRSAAKIVREGRRG